MSQTNSVGSAFEEGSIDSRSNAEAPSYNSWRYADEASLYSIAEDSREDRLSSRASRTESQPPPPTAPPPSLLNEQEKDDESVEIRWITAQDIEEASGGGNKHDGVVPVPSRDPDLDSDNSEEESLGPGHNARRSALFVLFLMCAAVVIILSMTLAMRNLDNRSQNRVSGGIANPEGQFVSRDGPAIDPGPDVDPTQQGGAKKSPIRIDVRQMVWDAVTSCKQTDEEDLENEDMSQKGVFSQHSVKSSDASIYLI